MNALKNVESLVLVAVALIFSTTALLRAPNPAPSVPLLAKAVKVQLAG